VQLWQAGRHTTTVDRAIESMIHDTGCYAPVVRLNLRISPTSLRVTQSTPDDCALGLVDLTRDVSLYRGCDDNLQIRSFGPWAINNAFYVLQECQCNGALQRKQQAPKILEHPL